MKMRGLGDHLMSTTVMKSYKDAGDVAGLKPEQRVLVHGLALLRFEPGYIACILVGLHYCGAHEVVTETPHFHEPADMIAVCDPVGSVHGRRSLMLLDILASMLGET